MMVNECLWFGYFDYWVEEGVIIFCYVLLMLDWVELDLGEVCVVLVVGLDVVNMFVFVFNFVIWVGKILGEVFEVVLFEMVGEV